MKTTRTRSGRPTRRQHGRGAEDQREDDTDEERNINTKTTRTRSRSAREEQKTKEEQVATTTNMIRVKQFIQEPKKTRRHLGGGAEDQHKDDTEEARKIDTDGTRKINLPNLFPWRPFNFLR
ncbi:hypothetical protein B5X24_HaOG206847 [Helicoverpa armigera]|uniref:Uncharacterized protein n=1 Tax=Helicoverpa armigera TaxID=29058 RepID=A0A2W1BIX5_HELAM|nr:hypothetical protein B5X24_HaOG206847 [Helicoverpa armigera]